MPCVCFNTLSWKEIWAFWSSTGSTRGRENPHSPRWLDGSHGREKDAETMTSLNSLGRETVGRQHPQSLQYKCLCLPNSESEIYIALGSGVLGGDQMTDWRRKTQDWDWGPGKSGLRNLFLNPCCTKNLSRCYLWMRKPVSPDRNLPQLDFGFSSLWKYKKGTSVSFNPPAFGALLQQSKWVRADFPRHCEHATMRAEPANPNLCCLGYGAQGQLRMLLLTFVLNPTIRKQEEDGSLRVGRFRWRRMTVNSWEMIVKVISEQTIQQGPWNWM